MSRGPPSPSTLKYRDRLAMMADSPFEYNTLYANSVSSDVWTRLTADAAFRTASVNSRPSTSTGSNTLFSPGNLSGFVSNTSKPPTPGVSFKSGFITEGEPIETLHPIVARRFKKKHPVPFYAAIRPDTETMTQTMRMLGTYSTDHDYANQFEIFIPAGCPGGRGNYHPDVTVTHRPRTIMSNRKS